MPAPNDGFLSNDQSTPTATSVLPPWLASSSMTATVRPPPPSPSPSPSVTLTLSPLTAPTPSTIPWLQTSDRLSETPSHNVMNGLPSIRRVPLIGESPLISELVECCKELEEGQRALAAQRKEAAWRLKRVELQLESEKACRRRKKMEDTEAKVNALREEQKAALDQMEAEYREQLAGLRREAEAKEQKLVEQWAAKHLHLTKFLEQMGCRGDPNGR